MLDRIIIGTLGVVTGIAFVIYARDLVRWFGSNATMERYLGVGGTYTGLRLLGLFIALVFFLYLTGFLETVVIAFFRWIGLM
ncbi:MAG: hypothetical protein HF312_21405 [Ignavibacteria bacterium]|jgi:hypothetical protein|nr:hypothetical protein [Ignavibacteria bacterium]